MDRPGGLGVPVLSSANKQVPHHRKQSGNPTGAAIKKMSQGQHRSSLVWPRVPPEPLSEAREGNACGTSQTAFHTHQLQGVLICDRFLLGACNAGLGCIQHHTSLPYHWQLRLKASKMWVSLGPIAQEHIERNYCNMNTSKVTLKDSDDSLFEMDLNSLDFSLSQRNYDQVRRLCNSSDPSVNPHFPAQWRVCWQNNGLWEDYEEPLSEQLNAAFERGAWNHAFKYNGQIYNVDLKEFTQRNVKTGYTRGIQRRPIYWSYQSMELYQKTMNEGYMCVPRGLKTDEGIYPPTWLMHHWDPNTAFLKVPVACTDTEYTMVETRLHETLPEEEVMVVNIYRIQNKLLWRQYTCMKEFMFQGMNDAEKSSLEKYLYHGTTQDNVDPICRLNFDHRLSGINGTVYGKGSYFALDASYSNSYSHPSEKGYRHMFLVKVLVGQMVKGKASYRRPPSLGTSGTLYDSCVDNPVDPKIFVIFNNCQCYPLFLIQYKLLSDPILITE